MKAELGTVSDGEEFSVLMETARRHRPGLTSPGIKVFCYLVFFLGPHPMHMEVPRLGVKLEPLLAYATATARLDLSHICNLY